ncbi:unnamed protein product [Dovyalis caffra]|uniref:Uncharacterized protein n=1 Tax=Dovyalis caffra TaxID=77055 RepID=A0AAV1SLX8_9ROSI|nr:unnamed protein product [Dovyalis caffra]
MEVGLYGFVRYRERGLVLRVVMKVRESEESLVELGRRRWWGCNGKLEREEEASCGGLGSSLRRFVSGYFRQGRRWPSVVL